MNIQNHIAETGLAVDRVRVAVISLILGALLVVGVGFAPLDVVHNAAHDGRHVFAFPCH